MKKYFSKMVLFACMFFYYINSVQAQSASNIYQEIRAELDRVYEMILLNTDYELIQEVPFAVLYKPVFPEPLTPPIIAL